MTRPVFLCALKLSCCCYTSSAILIFNGAVSYVATTDGLVSAVFSLLYLPKSDARRRRGRRATVP